jgi:hypothetical protein
MALPLRSYSAGACSSAVTASSVLRGELQHLGEVGIGVADRLDHVGGFANLDCLAGEHLGVRCFAVAGSNFALDLARKHLRDRVVARAELCCALGHAPATSRQLSA